MKHVPILLTIAALLFIGKTASAQFTPSQMIKEWERSKIYTKQYLDAMPEDGYGFKPTPEIRSFAAQMLHLAEANYFFASSASGNPIPEERKSIEKDVPPTKEAVTKAVMDSYDFMIHCVQGMTQEKMDEISKGKSGFKLIQFLSLGIPVIASPIGVNVQIVDENINGFLCQTKEEWIAAFEKLIYDNRSGLNLGAILFFVACS